MTKLVAPTREDLPELLKLTYEFLSESRFFSGIPADPATIVESWLWVIESGQWARLGVVDGSPQAVWAAKRQDLIFSKCHVVQDIFFYVRKDFRSRIDIRRVLRDLKEWAYADPMCVAISIMGPAYKGGDEKFTRVFTSLGYPPHGNVLINVRK